MKMDSIIFDLDGTLWDPAEGICFAWNEVLSKRTNIKKQIVLADLKKCMGMPLLDIGKKLFPDIDEGVLKELMKECCIKEEGYLEEHGGNLFPNLEETLKQLYTEFKLYIVSNCQDGYIQCFFKSHNLGKYFLDIECEGSTKLPKSENIKLIIKRNNLKNPIYVGDTKIDAEAAKIAKTPFIYANYGFGKVEQYDYSISSFNDLLKLPSC